MYGWQESLPEVVREWAELPSNDPQLYVEERGHTLISILNDDYNYTFAQLKELIQEQL